MNGRSSTMRNPNAGLVQLCASLLLALALLCLAACDQKSETPMTNSNKQSEAAPSPRPSSGKRDVALIQTDLGNIKVELLDEEAPQTVDNFRQLAKRGFYNGLIFHRVISGFMIQGGDPRGDGTGGESATGQQLPNEINPSSPLYQSGYKRGMIAMANKGTPQTATSQFFIMHQDYPGLRPNYTVFGRVIEGMDVVDKIAAAPTGGRDRPLSPVKMKKISIE
jgi:cyclophilin family peptidyl-prolyl cis-trans isomerase